MVKRSKKPISEAEWLEIIRRQTAGGETVNEHGEVSRRGMEVPDPRPVAIPAGFKRPETLSEQVRRLVRMERLNGDEEVDESWDEANDFDIGDDFDPKSPWETMWDQDLQREVTPEDYAKRLPEMRRELEKRLRNHYRALEAAEREEELLTRGVRGAPPSPSSEPSAEPKS